MKKTIALVLLLTLVAGILLTSCGKNEPSAPSGMKTASGEGCDFYLFVPESWTVDFSTAAAGAYYSKNDPSSVSVTAWVLEHTDDTIDMWWDMNKGEIASVFNDFALVSEENTTVDGLYAKKYIYTASLGEFKYKFMQVATIKNATVYLLTYTATESTFDSHSEDVGKITEAFKIK